MNSIKEHLVLLYCTVDDLLKKQTRGGEWRHSNNKPRFTDTEVLVMALMQSYFRTDTLKRTYLLVKANRYFKTNLFIGQSQCLSALSICLYINNG